MWSTLSSIAGTGSTIQSNVLGPEVVRMVNEFTTKEMRRG